jgi:hypothetical protein
MTYDTATADEIYVDWNFVGHVRAQLDIPHGVVNAAGGGPDAAERRVGAALNAVYLARLQGADDRVIEQQARAEIKKLSPIARRGLTAKITRRDVLYKLLGESLVEIKKTLCTKSRDDAFAAAVSALAVTVAAHVGLGETAALGMATLLLVWVITATKRALCKLTTKQILALLNGEA